MRTFLPLLLASLCAFAADAPSVTGISALSHDGQTFLTWDDVATGSSGANYRYRIYWSHFPIVDAPSLASATFLQEAFNNSGQLAAAGGTWNQTTRQNGALPMSIISPGSCGGPTYTACGTQLAAFTGLAVHTITSTMQGYYAVITHDRTGALTDSPVSPGNNAMTSPVSETIGTPLPIKIYDSHDTVNRNSGTSSATISGNLNLPIWFSFSGDGACTDYKSAALAFGDLWQFYGNAFMGYQEGTQQMFSVQEDHTGGTYGTRSLYLSHCSLVWANTGLSAFDPIYSGYLWPDSVTYQSYVENAITYYAQWAISQYGANPNRVYQSGQSAGAYAGDWAIRHPEIFAAVFDSANEWERQIVPSMASSAIITATSSMLMAGTGQQFLTAFNMPTYISSHCAGPLPFIALSLGRNDISQGNMWAGVNDMVAALKACHAGFAFAFNNGIHADGLTAMNALRSTYQTAIAKNVSYPAFANDSADNITATDCMTGISTAIPSPKGAGYNHVPTLTVSGSGGASLTAVISGGQVTSVTINNAGSYLFTPTVTVTPTGGDTPSTVAVIPIYLAPGSTCQINGGFSWATPTDTSTTWSSAISNTGGTLTADVTPRNTQAFHLTPGAMVSWTASTGQNGNLTADAYGLVTAPAVTVNSGAATTVTFAYSAPPAVSIAPFGGSGLAGGVVVH